MKRLPRVFLPRLCILAALSPLFANAQAKKIDSYNASTVHQILRSAYTEIKSNYYDPTFHGIDIDAVFKEYDASIDKAASLGEALNVVTAFLNSFHDSHLFFIPPARGARLEPGYRIQMVDQKCFVTRLRPGSPAAEKLHLGDEVVRLNSFGIQRQALHDMLFYFRAIAPMRVEQLEVKDLDGNQRTEAIPAIVRTNKPVLDITSTDSGDYWDLVRLGEEGEHLTRERVSVQGDAVVWKMAEFGFGVQAVDDVMGKAKGHGTLIIDLRGNPGGYEVSLAFLIGRLFDHDIKIADRVARKPQKPQIAKHYGETFKGKVVALVDSNSASSSEIFARVLQLEHRGTVAGDRTAGAVMQARSHFEQIGTESLVLYGFSITSANVVMSDGVSLEHFGVLPDTIIVPTAKDLADGKDPVLAKVLTDSGTPTDAAAAGKLFPFEWAKL